MHILKNYIIFKSSIPCFWGKSGHPSGWVFYRVVLGVVGGAGRGWDGMGWDGMGWEQGWGVRMGGATGLTIWG